jgi:DNA modification methylase
MRAVFLIPTLLFLIHTVEAQQIGDHSFDPRIENPEYAVGKGPLIILDEAHNNFHTLEGRYRSFGQVMIKDGYRVESGKELFSPDYLNSVKILVIANAIHENDTSNWVLPQTSAFTNEEIEAVNRWVKEGGRLFLIADHMPFPGAAEDLAASFGFEMINGFAIRQPRTKTDQFSRENNMLKSTPITDGRNQKEKVNTVVSFTGQGFKIPDNANSIITFDQYYFSLNPDTAWRFNEKTPSINLKDYSQGAYMEYGKGKIVVFGEAAMFTTQIAGRNKRKIGMNSDEASENLQFLRNIIHWLDKDVQ